MRAILRFTAIVDTAWQLTWLLVTRVLKLVVVSLLISALGYGLWLFGGTFVLPYLARSVTHAQLDIKPAAISEARKAGYTDDEIASYLAQKYPDQFKAASDAGYSSREILDYLGEPQHGAPGTPRAACWAKEPGPWCDYR